MSESLIIGIAVGIASFALQGLMGWLFRRSVGSFEAVQIDHESRLRKLESGDQLKHVLEILQDLRERVIRLEEKVDASKKPGRR
jgi:hypothetical protein